MSFSLFSQAAKEIDFCGISVKAAVMGCAVNGPGEARDADIGLAGSRNGKVIIFRFGEVCGTYDAEKGFEVFKSELLKHIKKRERIFSENQGV